MSGIDNCSQFQLVDEQLDSEHKKVSKTSNVTNDNTNNKTSSFAATKQRDGTFESNTTHSATELVGQAESITDPNDDSLILLKCDTSNTMDKFGILFGNTPKLKFQWNKLHSTYMIERNDYLNNQQIIESTLVKFCSQSNIFITFHNDAFWNSNLSRNPSKGDRNCSYKWVTEADDERTKNNSDENKSENENYDNDYYDESYCVDMEITLDKDDEKMFGCEENEQEEKCIGCMGDLNGDYRYCGKCADKFNPYGVACVSSQCMGTPFSYVIDSMMIYSGLPDNYKPECHYMTYQSGDFTPNKSIISNFHGKHLSNKFIFVRFQDDQETS